MPQESAVATLSNLSAPMLGVFRGRDAVAAGVTRKQLGMLRAQGVIERVHPDVYRMTAVRTSPEQRLRAALAWAGDGAAAAGTSAAEMYELERVRAVVPEVVVPRSIRRRSTNVRVLQGYDNALMVREIRGIRVTGVECTLLRIAATLDEESFGNCL